MVGGRWSVVGGRWSVVGGQWSVVGGQWSVVGGRWSVVSGRGQCVNIMHWQTVPATAMQFSEIIASSSREKNCNHMKDDGSTQKLLCFSLMVGNFYDL